jgi:hypothetical protein
MKVYMFCAALLCESCGTEARTAHRHTMPVEFDQDDESSYDSDNFPKGPYTNGGGEADTPQHCDSCGVFLENPLTPDGDAYVRNAAKEFETPGADQSWAEIADKAEDAGRLPLAEWIRHYLAWGQ